MKPLYLEMTAFGCYAEKAVVPFEDLKDDLYLVTGDTGAGKTTIFDAIVFALYGEASGSERDASMLHSDYVDQSVDTVVKLRFAHNGKEYTVKRSLHFRKGSGKKVTDAELTEPDGRAPIKGDTKVTKRCEELLNLKADQFRKIIMLAQGEFRKFLVAPTDEKEKILDQLFDNSRYEWYQNLLIGARDKLRAERDEAVTRRKNLLEQVFVKPPECDATLFQPEHPALLENLGALIEAEKAEFDERQHKHGEKQKEIDALYNQQGAAKIVNALFSKLNAERLHLEQLERQQDDYARRKEALERADVAFHKAQPAITKCEDAEKQVKETRDAIVQLNAAIERQKGEAESAQALVVADAPLEVEVKELFASIQKLDKDMTGYHDLAQKVEAQRKAAEAVKQAEGEKADKENALSQVNEKLEQLNRDLEALKNVDAEVVERKSALKDATERFEGVNALTEDVKTLRGTAVELTDAQRELSRRAEVALKANNKHASLYERFIAGQAGLLADDLRHKLTEAGEAACPVCGTALCREHMPNLAALSNDTPDAKAVKKARDEADKCEEARAKQDKAVGNIQTRQIEECKAAEEHARKCLDDFTGWQQLLEGDYLANAIAQAKESAKSAKKALSDAEGRQKQRDQLTTTRDEQDKAKGRLQAEIETARETASNKNAEAQRLAGEIETLKKGLDFEDEAAALAEKKRQEALKAEKEGRIQAHEKALDNANRALHTSEGTLDEKKNALEGQEGAAKAARDDMLRVLAETRFANPAEVRVALAPMGGEDGETWLAAERKAQSDYENNVKNTCDQVRDLEEQTQGKAETDMTELEARIKTAEGERQQLQDACERVNSLLENHNRTLKDATAIHKALAAKEGAFDRLNTLARLAEGEKGDGGRLSFKRYVMSAVFGEVLDMANLRLDRLSGGRYELRHNEGGTKRTNAQAGFEIEVVDNNTIVDLEKRDAKKRDAKSLSGGEGFFTSLALALGLSDVVQSHAGGKKMDALFIDEGFGTLDNDVLNKAVEVLKQLTEGNRLVGIISHVGLLEEPITQKIRVRSGKGGSTIDPLEIT